MKRVGAIDCGTNSLRLLIADVADGKLVEVLRRMEIVRLGSGVDSTGRLSLAALERTRAALVEYATDLERHRPDATRMVATSAVRDAANVDEFHAMVRDVLGVAAEVISGDEEAKLSYVGAVGGLDAATGPYLMVDIGGGSTELVYGETPDSYATSISLDVGAVRLTERHLHSDPPTPAQIEAAERDVRSALARATRVPLRAARTVVGVAGSVTTIVAIDQGLTEYQRERVHHARVPVRRVSEIADGLLRSPQAERRVSHPVIHPGRVDVIGAGALILREILLATGASELLCSEQDILDGVALSVVDGKSA